MSASRSGAGWAVRGQTVAALAPPVAVIALAAGLRLWGLDSRGLWYDEAYSVALARMPWSEMLAATARDFHPPLYYWLLGRWLDLFGAGEIAVRLLSALLGILTVAFAIRLGEELGGRVAGLLTGLAMAVSPFHLLYSQETRMYALVLAGATLASIFAWRAARLEPAWRWAPWYILAAATATYAHNSMAFALFGLNFAYLVLAATPLLRLWRRAGVRALSPLAQWLGCQVAVLALLAPWLPVLLEQTSRYGAVNERLDLAGLLAMVGRAFTVGDVPAAGTGWAPPLAWLFVAGGLALPVLRSRGAGATNPRLAGAVFAAAWLGAGLLLLSINVVGRRDFSGRHVLVLLPAFYFLFSNCLLEIARLWRPAAAVGVVVLIPVLASVGAYYADPYDDRPDHAGPMRAIAALARPGDVVVLDAPYLKDVFDYYQPAGLPAVGLPEEYPPDPLATRAALADLAARYRRIWLVLWQDYYADPQALVRTWLRDNQVPVSSQTYNGGVELRGYEVRAPGDTVFGGVIALEGVEVVDFKAGWEAKVRLRWRCLAPPGQDYQVFVHLVDDANRLYGQHDGTPNGGQAPTSRWQSGDLVNDEHVIRVPDAAAGKELTVRVGLYSLADGKRLPSGAGDSLLLMRADVAPAGRP